MKVEIVNIAKFNFPVCLEPGDTLRVSHTWQYEFAGPVHERVLSQQDIPEAVTWTHSILFKLNGTLNHIIGDQDTVDWLESL